jgi:hypothetical protein
MALPIRISRFFWDIDTSKSAPHKHKKYYILRILDKGDKKAVSWIIKMFGKRVVRQVAVKSRLSPRSANYWRKFFELHDR